MRLGLFVAMTLVLLSGGIMFSLHAYADNSNAEVIIQKNPSKKECQSTNSCYSPFIVVIRNGETVTWKNMDSNYHLVTGGSAQAGPDASFGSKIISPHETYSYTFGRTGVYPYFCTLHPWMTGMVIVKNENINEAPSWSEMQQASFWKVVK